MENLSVIMTKTVSIIVTNNRDEILVLKRSSDKKWYPHKWDIISGKLKNEEDPEEGFKRELKEETGIKSLEQVENKKPYIYKEKGRQWLVHPYRCKVKQEEVQLNNEHCDYQWVSLEKLLNLNLARPVKLELKPFYNC